MIVPQSSGVAQSVAPPPQAAQRKSGTPWIVILAVACGVLVVCGGILTALLLPAVQAARETREKASCMNRVKQINLAFLNYESAYRHFPPASGGMKGQPMSWRVAILPFIEQDFLYKQYRQDEPWNSPNNLAIAKQMPREFLCPSDSEAGAGETSYVMITGENTIGGTPDSSGVSPRQITDGTSNTILIVEVHGLKIPWTEPRDITLDELLQRVRSGARIGHVTGFNVGMADGSVHFLSTTFDAETLRRLAIINDGQPVNIIELLSARERSLA